MHSFQTNPYWTVPTSIAGEEYLPMLRRDPYALQKSNMRIFADWSSDTELDPAATGLAAVVWCTGLRGDFGWISVSGALDASGEPIHDKCVSPIPGLCFAGLDLAVTRRSGIVPGVTEEAPRLARAMAAHIAQRGSG